jgi:hypothetical protein
MATNEIADPSVQEADQRAERAKASLLSRVELLKHKFSDARHKLDLKAQITEHPLPSVAVAVVLGMLAGLRRSPAMASIASGGVRQAAGAALTAFGLRLVRNVALGQLAEIARQWWTEQQAHSERQAPPAPGSGVAGRAPSLER